MLKKMLGKISPRLREYLERSGEFAESTPHFQDALHGSSRRRKLF